MPVLSSFCGILTLQVGAAILAIVFFTLSGVIAAANIFDYRNPTGGWPLNLILVVIFIAGLIIIGLFMFASAYSEVRSCAIAAVVVLVILLCYWIVLCCFSFFGAPEHVREICINTRCPESFWIANLGYRRQGRNETSGNSTNSTQVLDVQSSEQTNLNEMGNNSTNRTATPKNRSDTSGYSHYAQPINLNVEKYLEIDIIPDGDITKVKVMTDSAGYNAANNFTTFKQAFFYNKNSPYKMFFTLNDTRDDDDSSNIVYGFPFSGAVILFFANLLFLVFAALVMWSWASELDWGDYYAEDEQVVVYEEG